MSRCATDTALLISGDQHARSCARCRTRLAMLSGPVPAVDRPAPDLPEHGLDAQVLEALNDVPARRPEPGQVWRLEFDGAAVPVAVVEVLVGEQEMAVAPVGEDPAYADAASVIVDALDGPLGFEFGIWTAVEHVVPLFTADRLLGTLPDDAWSQVQRCRRSLRDGAQLEGAGAPLTSDLDPRLDYRASLEADLLALSVAAWEVLQPEPLAMSFREVLDELGIGRQQLRELGFSNHELGALAEERLILNDQELARIAEQAEVSIQQLQRSAPRAPRDLVIELHTPQRRRQLLEVGQRHDHGPSQERREAVRGVVMAGKRTADADAEPDWSDALDKWFAQR